jgi:hypothetical protein
MGRYLALILTLVFCPSAFSEGSQTFRLSPKARQKQEWGNFRRAFPYHIQAIAASAPYEDGTRTLIVSEPPPHVTLRWLKNVAPFALVNADVKGHTIGHDDWVKDVVFNIKANKEELDDLVARPSQYLSPPLWDKLQGILS